MKALFGEKYDPVSWDGDMWEDPNEVGDIEPLNSFLLVEESSPNPVEVAPTHSLATSPILEVSVVPPLSEKINSALPSETVMVSPEALAM